MRDAWAARADIGARRAQQDRWIAVRLGGRATLYAVADGTGPEGAGELCAALALDRLVDVYRHLDDPLDAGDATRAVREADAAVTDALYHRRMTGGAELAFAVVRDGAARLGWLGGCRIWRWRGGALTRLCRDHPRTQRIQARYNGSLISGPHEATAPHDVLTPMLGYNPGDLEELETVRVELEAGDRLLLGTDGLYRGPTPPGGRTTDAWLAGFLSAYPTPDEVAEALIGAALTAGNQDNVAAIVVDPARG